MAGAAGGLPRGTPIALPHHKLHVVRGTTNEELVVRIKIGEGKKDLEALLDSGAYSNYLSQRWATNNLDPIQIQPVTGEYIQLGGTDTQLPILGRTRLWVYVGAEQAKISFNIFETERDCIMV